MEKEFYGLCLMLENNAEFALPLLKQLLAKNDIEDMLLDDEKYKEHGHPIHMVSQFSLNITRLLIDAGVNINLQCSRGMTPLMYAAMYDCSIVEFLIKSGANVNQEDDNGETALHKAVQSNLTDVIASLLAGGANINQQSHDEFTPLMEACECGSREALLYLINEGADVNIASCFDSTILTLLLRDRYLKIELVKLVIDAGADVNQICEGGMSPLMLACQKNPHVVQFLLDSGADINTRYYENGSTALLFAAQHNTSAIQPILDAGADINTLNDNGQNALYWALHNGNHSAIPVLVDAGIDILYTTKIISTCQMVWISSYLKKVDKRVITKVIDGVMHKFTLHDDKYCDYQFVSLHEERHQRNVHYLLNENGGITIFNEGKTF